MKRRTFIKSLTASAVAETMLPTFALPQKDAGANDPHLVVAVRKGEPDAMFKKGIAALGGMGAFVKTGQTVCVKPNIGWDRTPEFGANTNPGLVGEIVRACIAAGAKKVVVFDHTCNNWQKCYLSSGIRAAVEAAGGEMLPANLESQYASRKTPAAVNMREAKICKTWIESDVLINVPVLKHHGGAKLSSAMKNLMGVVWDRGYMHRNNLPQCISDLCLYRKPDLNIVDGYRVMFQHGPQGVTPDDTKVVKYQFLSRDIVAVDAMSAKLMSWPQTTIPYLAMAEKAGLGIADTTRIAVKRLEA